MALSNSQYDSIMRIYNQAQLRQKHELDKRREEIYEKIPAVKELNEEIASSAVKSARQLLAGDDRAAKAEGKDCRSVRGAPGASGAYGYPADYLELHYDCPSAAIRDMRTGASAAALKRGRLPFCTISPTSGKF